ncbi:MAG: 2,3-bisphosphoglycerate-independent phosphoglycerate mutase [Planctomycetota bacterium]
MASPTVNTPVVLVIRDGWGRNPHPEQDAGNAVLRARCPFDAAMQREWPSTLIRTSGEDVGLPETPEGPVMGNSEVGHQNIGAGRIVDQELMRITRAIRDGRFAANAGLQSAFDHAVATGGCVHVLGLCSDGLVHSDLAHLEAILDLAAARSFPGARMIVHAITDGRDTGPTTGRGYIERVQRAVDRIGARIGSIMGRFWAMDRDHRWERVERAWRCLVGPMEQGATDARAALEHAYANPEGPTRHGDEFVPPKHLLSASEGFVRDGDAVIFFNFRGDRPRELTKAFVLDEASFRTLPGGGFDRGHVPTNLRFVTMANYEEGLPVTVAFERPARMEAILGQVISDAGLTQFRCAETEKFPHVTFFFNDYREDPFPGEHRVIVPSPKDVPTYDLKPEMSAHGVRDAVLARLAAADCEPFIIVNFANGDMVGHTGNLDAASRACEVVDACVAEIARATLARGGSLIVTADHGNAEQMIDPVTGDPQTAHTNFTVPLSVLGEAFRGRRLREGGRLADIAPTMLAMAGLPKPAAMTGSSLLA